MLLWTIGIVVSVQNFRLKMYEICVDLLVNINIQKMWQMDHKLTESTVRDPASLHNT